MNDTITVQVGPDVYVTHDAASITGVPAALLPNDCIPTWEEVMRETGEDSLPIGIRAWSGRPIHLYVRWATERNLAGNPEVPWYADLTPLTEDGMEVVREFLSRAES
jgi:hypothetical protein